MGVLMFAAASSSAAAADLESTIAFSTNRDNLEQTLPLNAPPALRFEAYLMNADGTNLRRLTYNNFWDGFANISPNGKRIVFDSNQNHPAPGTLVDASGQPCPFAPGGMGMIDPAYVIADLFLTDWKGKGSILLAPRADSATWSPDSKRIAFHASASGAGCPSRSLPGSAAVDSDIFVAKVNDLVKGVKQPTNVTNTPDKIDDDPDWSSSGRIVYTAHDVGDDVGAISNTSELYVTNADGGGRVALTHNDYEERAPAWSPDGKTIVYLCRIGGGINDSEICVIDAHPSADGSSPQPIVLTNNTVADLTPSYSPDGEQIVFHRPVPPFGAQLFTMAPRLNPDGTLPTPTPLTFGENGEGMNMIASWGELKVTTHGQS
ncbi:MAG TPA: hypothetical protein VFZ00_08505 [Solirubrobacter sp.]|nr:hypothetical protein [Solirubrobacter sp.]